MTHRYYVPDLVEQGSTNKQGSLVTLPAEEVQHACKVMRCQVGDRVELFDGQGYQASATITVISRKDCICSCEPIQSVDREPRQRLRLITALPKPDRAKEMIERLAELGVWGIQPIVFQHTQRPPSDATLKKLHRTVIESCKQSGRNRRMVIEPTLRFSDWLSELCGDESAMRLIARPGGLPWQQWAIPLDTQGSSGHSGDADFMALVGPEGGFSPEELVASEQAGFTAVGLGSRILRIETAACVIASRLLLS